MASSNESEPITEIQLIRSAKWGFAEGYRVTLKEDGTATYVGSTFVDKTGRFVGTVKSKDYKRILKKIYAVDYFQMEDHYPPPNPKIHIHSDTVTTIVFRGGTQKSVTHYEGNGSSVVLESPSKEELNALKNSESVAKKHNEIVRVIDDVVAQIQWKKAE